MEKIKHYCKEKEKLEIKTFLLIIKKSFLYKKTTTKDILL
jgi:hypothetical protein